jgi:hypothetical protein
MQAMPHHRWKILAGKPAAVETKLNDIYNANHPDIWIESWKPVGNTGSIIMCVRVGITEKIHNSLCAAAAEKSKTDQQEKDKS